MKKPQISIHAPKALKPQSSSEFGFFLAGLIDSDGYISQNEIKITFHTKDKSVAYYVKKMIGYGSVVQIKNKPAVNYICEKKQGLIILANLVRNKLKDFSKIDQFNLQLTKKLSCEKTNYVQRSLDQNHWLSGFLQGSGNLQIKQISNANTTLNFACRQTLRDTQSCGKGESKLVVQINHKMDTLLNLIKTEFGGYVGHDQMKNTFYYSSVNFRSASKFIQYLDRYQLMGSNLTAYWLWRKAYLLVQNRLHLTEAGSRKIAFKKAMLSQFRSFANKKGLN
uniref:Putative LAGLIDADG homing endonuclease n=1 Tax=Gloeotilopsis planctonica TaxID=34157 RepID=A0A1B2RZ09_9CHLO|nr:putative LAGLIDADG homing endonuclease [Gloeotilopsis planctonica]